jgi:hypothetical protein
MKGLLPFQNITHFKDASGAARRESAQNVNADAKK